MILCLLFPTSQLLPWVWLETTVLNSNMPRTIRHLVYLLFEYAIIHIIIHQIVIHDIIISCEAMQSIYHKLILQVSRKVSRDYILLISARTIVINYILASECCAMKKTAVNTKMKEQVQEGFRRSFTTLQLQLLLIVPMWVREYYFLFFLKGDHYNVIIY